MNKNNVIELERRAISADPLTELLKEGARKLLAEAVESEVQELLAKYQDWRTESGHAGVVRNGYLPERELQTGLGPIRVRIPKVRSKTGEAVSFQSVLVPPYVRKTATFEAAIPWLYLKGVSSGEMAEALRVLVGPQAQGLSASTVSRLKQVWAEEYRAWSQRRLGQDRWVYVWADGVYSGLRAEDAKLCALVAILESSRVLSAAIHNMTSVESDRVPQQGRWTYRLAPGRYKDFRVEARTLLEKQIVEGEELLEKFEEAQEQDGQFTVGIGWYQWGDQEPVEEDAK